MKKYRFFDHNIFGPYEEYDLEGTQYMQLLETCFRYCTCVAFRIDSGYELGPVSILSQLDKYQIPVTKNITNLLGYDKLGEIFHYRLCLESQAMIRSITNSIFSWSGALGHNHPDDLSFFREDGSVFFNSVVHEGYCTLYVRDDEDVSHIISAHRWVDITNEPWKFCST